MIWQSKRSTRLSITVILSIFLVSALVSTVAYAFGNRLTYIPDMNAGGTEGAIDLHLKNVAGIARVVKNKLGAYYPKETGRSANGKTLKIIEGKVHRACNIAGYITGNVYVKITIADNEKTHRVPIQQVCNGGQFYGKTFAFPNGQLIKDGSGYYKANIEVGLDTSAADVGRSGSDSNSFNYDIQLTGNNSAKGLLALRANNSEREFGLRSSYADGREGGAGSQTVRAKVAFGYPCNISNDDLNDPENRTVKLYDADGVFGDTYMWVTKNGNKLNSGDYIKGRLIGDWNDDYKGWKVEQSNLDYNSLILRKSVVEPNAEYKLVIYNDGHNRTFSPHGNTLSVAIPYDSIYGTPTCDYNLIPDVNPPQTSSDTVPHGATIPMASVVGNIAPNGVDSDSHAWQLTARVYKDNRRNLGSTTDTDLNACDFRTGTTGPACRWVAQGTDRNGFDDTFSHAMDQGYDTTGLEPGNSVCFMMSVKKPTYDSPVDKWRHSPLKCIGIAGASPGVSVDPATYSYFPNLQITADIRNEGGYPKVDHFMDKDYKRNQYAWKLMEAKFSQMPSNIGTSDRGGCNTVREVDGFLNNSCAVIDQGDNLFPEAGDPSPISASSRAKGPDPIGTWTCYTFSYLTNPPPLDDIIHDIRWYYRDWNDDNATSETSRWGDGYSEWTVDVPADYDDEGNLIREGYSYRAHSGSKLSLASRDAQIAALREDATPPKYEFTDYTSNSCSQSGIDPKVQVRGNDLKVEKSVATFVRTMEVGNAIGSYGSGGEYGVLSGGLNSGFASGSGMIRGLSSTRQEDWSTLTFTNSSPGGFGNFNSVPPKNVQIPEGSVPYDGRTAYNGGEKIIYQKVVGTLVINSNITYANSYNLVGQIPRVVIVADNIEIGPNVTRIDPWLIADNISTCGPPRGAGWGASASMAMGNADLRTGECNRPLIFNGPVYATNLYLYRTGGSRIPKDDLRSSWANPDAGIDPSDYCEGNDCRYEASMSSTEKREARQYMLSAPAEVFNLRPDVFLSSFAGASTGNPVATTDKVTELPPRF